MPKPLYTVGVVIYATAYVRADSGDEARQIAKSLGGDELFLAGGGGRLKTCTAPQFADMPDLSLSPVMTFHGPDAEDVAEPVE